MRISLGSFREVHPDLNLLMVNHDLTQEEIDFAESKQVTVCSEGERYKEGNQDHGAGLDEAALWCKFNDVYVLVIIEPDCVIFNDEWLRDLVSPIIQGDKWMTSSYKHRAGYYHPCGSAWLVEKIPCSFRPAPVASYEQALPEFQEILQAVEMLDEKDWGKDYYPVNWDAGGRPWFHCHVKGRSELVEVSAWSFFHLYEGSVISPYRILDRKPCNSFCYKRLSQFLPRPIPKIHT